MRKIKITLLTSIALTIFSCANETDSKQVDNTAKETVKEVVVEVVEEVKIENWEYSESVDEMSGDKIKYASCKSTNELDFKFPYAGGTNFALVVRNNSGQINCYLKMNKGQFMPGIGNLQFCRVKFDDGEAYEDYYSSPSDGSSETLFLNKTKALIKGLKTAKKLKVEAPFFNEGRQIVEFDVEGFVWE